MPQPVRAGEDYFAVLEAPRRFSQDTKALERRFFEISRALHPDRFTTAPIEARQASLERMSLLNDAYRTLKDRAALRDYVLEQAGLSGGMSVKRGGQMPLELAESWFELQDAMIEDSEAAAARIPLFEKEVADYRVKAMSDIERLEREIDMASDAASEAKAPSDSGAVTSVRAAFPMALLQELYSKTQTLSYLRSLERDLQSKRRAS
jgi:molecular chaperone HscB